MPIQNYNSDKTNELNLNYDSSTDIKNSYQECSPISSCISERLGILLK